MTSDQSTLLLDYHQKNASDGIVPKPAVLRSSGWNGMHLELHQQPIFATEEHQHTMHVLACGLAVLPGGHASGVRSLDGKKVRERRGTTDIAVIPAGISHRCSWDSPTQFIVLALEPTLLQQVGQDWVNPDRIELEPRFMSESDPWMHSILSTLTREAQIERMGNALLVDSLRTTLAIHLLRNYCVTRPRLSSGSSGLSQTRLTLVQDYIQAHLQQELTVQELAAIAQISPYHFIRLFKNHTGLTPHQYILQQRIEQAKHLLQHSQLSISEIALRTGFCDQSHLTRHFRRALGITPKQFLQHFVLE